MSEKKYYHQLHLEVLSHEADKSYSKVKRVQTKALKIISEVKSIQKGVF